MIKLWKRFCSWLFDDDLSDRLNDEQYLLAVTRG
jgi:hypothetical protein